MHTVSHDWYGPKISGRTKKGLRDGPPCYKCSMGKFGLYIHSGLDGNIKTLSRHSVHGPESVWEENPKAIPSLYDCCEITISKPPNTLSYLHL